MRVFSTAFAVLLLALVAGGCDKSGIHPLARKRDVTGSCTTPTSTWLRSYDGGTEILVIGSANPTDDTMQGTTYCFAHGTVNYDSSSTLDVGSYTLTGGSGTFTYPAHYYYLFEPQKGILDRTGSKRDDLSPPVDETIAFKLDTDGTLLATLGTDPQHRYTNLVDVIKRANPDTQSGAEDLYRLYNLPSMTEQNRMLGFGSAGMTQYVPSPGVFVGLISNSFSVSVESYTNPTVHITYDNFEDLTGIETEGDQVTYANFMGDGTMGGVIQFRMFGNGGPTDLLYAGSVDYSACIIKNGLGAGGYYTFTVDGHPTHQVPYSLANNMDFRGVLPIVTP